MPQLPPNSRGYDEASKRRARTFRKNANVSERVMWELLRKGGFKFRRQHAVGPYTLDFYCAEARLCVEVDGPMHDPDRDEQRDRFIHTLGVLTLRVPSADLFDESGPGRADWETEIRRVCEGRAGRKASDPPPPRHGRH